MKTPCPYCGQTVEIGITHQGVSAGGTFQRVLIEATHASGEGTKTCPEFATKGIDLISLATAASIADAAAPVAPEAPSAPAAPAAP